MDIRSEVEEAVGRPLSDAVWDLLEELGYISDLEVGATTASELGTLVKRMLAAFAQREPLRAGSTTDLLLGDEETASNVVAARQLALSLLVAQVAAGDDDVAGFRNEFLREALLSQADVADWIRRRAEDDGPPTVWFSIPSGSESDSEDWGVEASVENLGDGRSSHAFERRFLIFVKSDGTLDRIATSAGGGLERLRSLSRALAQRYGWTDAQASSFILTGATPLVPLVSSSVTANIEYSGLTRITLRVDPTLPAQTVAAAYQDVRGELVPGRLRSISEKHALLASFVASRSTEETWHERMIAWNREHPEWSYDWRSNFARDCARAQRRLLHPPIRMLPRRARNSRTAVGHKDRERSDERRLRSR